MKDTSVRARGSRRLFGRFGVLAAAVAVVVGALLAVTVPAALAATLYSNDFASGDLTGWTKSGGAWGLASDGTQVYQQSNVSSDDARSWYTPGSTFTDYSVQARVKPLAFGASTRFVALNARVQSATSEYRLALLDSNQAQLQAVSSGSVTVLGSTALTVTTGTWYSLQIQVSGQSVTGFVNGAQIGSGTSSLFSSGTVGFATFHATASFDDLLVSSIGPTPHAHPDAHRHRDANRHPDPHHAADSHTHSHADAERGRRLGHGPGRLCGDQRRRARAHHRRRRRSDRDRHQPVGAGDRGGEDQPRDHPGQRALHRRR
jgi:hypothetical protein